MSIEQHKLRSNLFASLIKNIQFNSNVNYENSYISKKKQDELINSEIVLPDDNKSKTF